ncbi:response regulator PleD [uncultured Clostridium sp.]|uniref:GGDEF domain-containing protein n=1 Tax=uncultured Clostridium sp. TaxID=59620 RepID=UPI00082145DC|nr:diguanylate cyclase [uncultured Clostridium sp.]SCJ40012.1 response regulator PleD [uncultured Clostridium sp.]
MNRLSIKIDSYFLCLILELFIVFSFFVPYRNEDNGILDFVMLCITFFSVMITYAGGIVVGLISGSVTIFIYASYIFYMNLVKGVSIDIISYVWMISISIVILTTGKLQGNINIIQDKNRKLKDDYENLVTIDETTGLGNIKLFYRSLEKEISKSLRHKSKCTLMLIKVPYYKEVIKIIGGDGTNALKRAVGDVITSSVRNEDEIYTIENDTLAVIMPNTDIEGAKIVKNRIKDKILDLNLKIKEKKDEISVDTKIAILEHTDDIKDAVEFKVRAEEELQYDV